HARAQHVHDAALAVIGGGIEQDIETDERGVVRVDPDGAAVAALAGYVKRTRVDQRIAGAGRHEADLAALVLDAAGADDAFVVDDVGEDVLRSAAREQDRAAVGDDLAGVAHGGVDAVDVLQHLAVDGKLDEPVAVEVHGDLAAGGEVHLPG